jgi:hypothetical protein
LAVPVANTAYEKLRANNGQLSRGNDRTYRKKAPSTTHYSAKGEKMGETTADPEGWCSGYEWLQR